ncbi:hypothetical protein BABINDRAFT_24586, partial [Babjeviella inositovora NRRL Y-12698]
SHRIAKLHQDYHVGMGLLYGPSKLEIDPILFINKEARELTSFYHLGSNLVAAEDGKIHNGLLATLIDESLCVAGFPYLPAGKGVTAKLSINFHKQIKGDTTVVLNAKVAELKGRKCVIRGTIQEAGKSVILADAECILVQPKWFKYISKLQIF